MKIINFFLVVYLALSIFLFNSCDSNPSDSLGQETLNEIINQESKSIISIKSFSKINGVGREIMGLPVYTLEFESQLQFEQSCWKKWNSLGSWMFSDFRVAQVSENSWGSSLQKFYKEATVNIIGKIDFEKTDNGWRKTDYKIEKATILNNPNPLDVLIGSWIIDNPDKKDELIISRLSDKKGNSFFEITKKSHGVIEKINYVNYEELDDVLKFEYHYEDESISRYNVIYNVFLQAINKDRIQWVETYSSYFGEGTETWMYLKR